MIEKLGWRLEHTSYFFMMTVLAPVGPMAGYSASKAAAHSITQALRAELRDRGITVLGAYPGGIDPDMLADVRVPKAPPGWLTGGLVFRLALWGRGSAWRAWSRRCRW